MFCFEDNDDDEDLAENESLKKDAIEKVKELFEKQNENLKKKHD